MDLFSLVSDIDRLLEATELDSQKVYPLLKQVRSYLLTLQPSAAAIEASPAVEEIVLDSTQKIHKLTDLLEFPGEGWSLALENSTKNVHLYLLEETTSKAYPLQFTSGDSLNEVEDLEDLQGVSSLELPQERLETALGEIKRVILCCSTWRHETVCLQLEQMLKIPEIFWLNPPITLLLSHLEKLQSVPTVVIWTGEAITEFAFVNVPQQKKTLSSCFWRLGSLKYGQESLLQDIFCHLVYPQWESQLTATLPKLHFTPPRSGQADSQTRSILQTQLQSHPLGSALLKSTSLIQNILTSQEHFTSQLQGQNWEVKRSDYHSQIISAYLEYLQVSIEDILKISPEDIQQVIWGGTLLESIHFSYLPWSSQTFPNAKFFTGLNLVSGLINVLNYPALFV